MSVERQRQYFLFTDAVLARKLTSFARQMRFRRKKRYNVSASSTVFRKSATWCDNERYCDCGKRRNEHERGWCSRKQSRNQDADGSCWLAHYGPRGVRHVQTLFFLRECSAVEPTLLKKYEWCRTLIYLASCILQEPGWYQAC